MDMVESLSRSAMCLAAALPATSAQLRGFMLGCGRVVLDADALGSLVPEEAGGGLPAEALGTAWPKAGTETCLLVIRYEFYRKTA